MSTFGFVLLCMWFIKKNWTSFCEGTNNILCSCGVCTIEFQWLSLPSFQDPKRENCCVIMINFVILPVKTFLPLFFHDLWEMPSFHLRGNVTQKKHYKRTEVLAWRKVSCVVFPWFIGNNFVPSTREWLTRSQRQFSYDACPQHQHIWMIIIQSLTAFNVSLPLSLVDFSKSITHTRLKILKSFHGLAATKHCIQHFGSSSLWISFCHTIFTSKGD